MTLAEGIGLVIAGAGWPVAVFAAWMARRQWHLRQPAVRWRRSNQPDGNTIIEGRVLTDRADADCVIVSVRLQSPRAATLHHVAEYADGYNGLESAVAGERIGRHWRGSDDGVTFLVQGARSAPLRIRSTVADRARNSSRSSFTSII